MHLPSIKQELRQLFHIGLPIAITQLAHNGISVTDTMMAGRVSPIDLAGVAIGSSVWVPIFLFMAGTLVATTALVSRAYGGGRQREIVLVTHQSFWLALGLSALAFLLCRFPSLYLDWLNIEPEVQTVAEGYLAGISWGIPAIAAYQVLRGYCEAQTDTRSVMILTLAAVSINIPANYLFVFGGLGIPAMGGAGTGYASGLVMWISLIMILAYTRFNRRYEPCRLFLQWAPPHKKQLGELARLGFPIGLAIFFEAALFCATSLAIAPLGAHTLASHQIVISITSFVFMIPLSIAMATTVRVGNLLGQEKYSHARFSSFCAVGLALAIACITAASLVLFRDFVVSWYTPEVQLQQAAAALLLIAALFQFSDAIQATSSGALRAYKDTRAIMYITFTAYWLIGFPCALLLGYSDQIQWLQGAQGFWLGLVIGLTFAAVLLGRRLNRLSKSHIQEQELSAAARI